ncbi:porin [Polynucleobacter sp. TUM22923]|uniref:porin n=1 Tax=Polynucleobacter sp. TUM22923 TaxID=3022126 RepID=UPI0025723FDE|nr:porin [Polynucleobacter sp. TUM22923]BDX20794.1 porin [Polynucleobacter sp. TUM22923]
MKKSLLAVAAIGAFASAAQAQSSVTVYGILDVGYIGGNVRSASSTGVPAKGTYSSIGSSAESTSRLGFRGTEDLGGGMSAFFTIETGVQPTNVTASTFNNRQTFVGLKDNKIGAISFGTQYTPIHSAVAVTSANQQNNMVGDAIYPIAPANSGNAGVVQATSTSNTDGYTIRTSNMVKVESNTVAGFKGTAFYTANNQDTTQAATGSTITGGTNNQNGWGVGVNYTWSKLLVTANYQALNSRQSANNVSPAIWSNATGGTNVRDNQMYFAGTYDFGILKAYAQYINRKATSQITANDYVSRTAQQIGVRSYITPAIEAWASAGTGRYDSFGVANPTVNFTAYQLGSNYYLSKRTNLYAIFGSTQQSSASASQPSLGANNYAVGVRHTF